MKYVFITLIFTFCNISINCLINEMECESMTFEAAREENTIIDRPTREIHRSLPLGAECDTNKSDCQCYGSRSLCGCGSSGAGRCICRLGSSEIEKEKKKCQNKEEWESKKDRNLPLGSECYKNEGDCQCFGSRSICGCGSSGAGRCICRLGSLQVAEEKKKCQRKEEWGSHLTCFKQGELCGEYEKCCNGVCADTELCESRCSDCMPLRYECDEERRCCEGLVCEHPWYTKTSYCQRKETTVNHG